MCGVEIMRIERYRENYRNSKYTIVKDKEKNKGKKGTQNRKRDREQKCSEIRKIQRYCRKRHRIGRDKKKNIKIHRMKRDSVCADPDN